MNALTSRLRSSKWLSATRSAKRSRRHIGAASYSTNGVAPNQVFNWRRLYAEGALSAVGAGEEVVPASEYRALQQQVRELQRLLGKKTLETEILREALELAHQKNGCCARPCPDGTTRHEDDRRCLGRRFERYNEHHPHKALRYRSPRQFRRANLATASCPA